MIAERTEDIFAADPNDPNYYTTPDGNTGLRHERKPREQEENWGGDLAGAVGKPRSRAKQVNHAERTRRWCEAQGWINTACEMKDLHVHGQQSFMGKKHDLFGLFDRIAIDPVKNRLVGIQVVSTSKNKKPGSSARDHLRKMCSEDIEAKTKRSFVENLRAWIRTGNPAVILDWEQRTKVGNQEWFPVVTIITTAMIADVESRRRKAA